jgi:hypothetical protein
MAQGFSYDDNLIREDLLDLITNLTPQETQLFSGLGTAEASSIRHEWGKDTLDSVAVNAKVEGAASTGRTLTQPERLINYTQILEKVYDITDTERAVDSAGFEDRLAYEADKAFRSLANDAEFALMRGSLVCGNNSTGRNLKGVKNWFTSNNYTAQSGVSLDETMLNDYFQEVWNDGTMVNAVYAPMRLKRRISTFSAANKLTVNTDAAARRVVNAVDIYQADAAQNVELHPHRYVQVSADTNFDLVGINKDMFRVAYLRRPVTEPLAKTGDSSLERVVMECTLECYHEDAGFYSASLL